MASNITDIAEANKKIDELEAQAKDLQAKAAASADLSKLPADQIAKALENPEIWKTKRLSDLREKAKKAEDLEKEISDLKGKADTPDQKVEELQKQLEKLQNENKTARIESAIKDAAVKAGVKNPSVIAKLIDRSGLEIGSDGTVAGVDDQIKALLTSDPYLKGDAKSLKIGEPPVDPEGQGGKKLFKASEINDPTFYRQHEKEIDQAIATGQIDDDTAAKAS